MDVRKSVAAVEVDWTGIGGQFDPFLGVEVEACAEIVQQQGEGAGDQTAIQNVLEGVEALVAIGQTAHAIRKLEKLTDRLDGCGEVPDANDWILDCSSQLLIRESVFLLITNLSG